MSRPGSYFRGRAVRWDPDARAIEQERQRWVMEKVSGLNEAIVELAIDPDQAYQVHRAEYERTGDLAQLRLALEYVR
jgi:hypothetical protein